MEKVSRLRLVYYALILLIAPILIYLFLGRDMRFFLVPSGSMEPTLAPGDYLLTLTKDHYDRGDIIVLVDPDEAQSYIVKRLVGITGDTVEIKGGALFLNGQYVSEPYLPEFMAQDMNPAVVPEGGVFVLGDNRNHSEDSSKNGQSLPVNTIIGEVRLRYLPLDRAGVIHGYPLIEVAGAQSR